jgi:hypothetical protein
MAELVQVEVEQLRTAADDAHADLPESNAMSMYETGNATHRETRLNTGRKDHAMTERIPS